MCTGCNTILKWKSKDGTSGLKAHLQSCETNNKPGSFRKLTDCVGVSTVATVKQLSIADRNDITNTIVRFCAKDVRPFSTIEGTGFMELANKLIAIGAKYGKISATDVL
jgi:hypothetical protein